MTSTIPLSDAERFYAWRWEIDRLMISDFAITISDGGIDDIDLRRHWETCMCAAEFVEWFGIKYDLIPVTEWRATSTLRVE